MNSLHTAVWCFVCLTWPAVACFVCVAILQYCNSEKWLMTFCLKVSNSAESSCLSFCCSFVRSSSHLTPPLCLSSLTYFKNEGMLTRDTCVPKKRAYSGLHKWQLQLTWQTQQMLDSCLHIPQEEEACLENWTDLESQTSQLKVPKCSSASRHLADQTLKTSCYSRCHIRTYRSCVSRAPRQ